MSTARLHLVPDPDDTPGPGLRAVPAQPGEPTVPEQLAAPDAGEPDDEAGEEPRRALAIPDLSEYCDVRALADLGPLAADVAKKTGPPLLRGIGAVLLAIARLTAYLLDGLLQLTVLVARWLSGQVGKKGSVGARFAAVGFAGYAAYWTTQRSLIVPLIAAAVPLIAAGLVASGLVKIPDGEAEKTPAKGKPKAAQKDAPAPAAKTTEGATPTDATAAPRMTFFGRLARRPGKTSQEQQDTPAQDVPAGTAEGQEEDTVETTEDPSAGTPVAAAAAPPAEPSRDDAIRALHHLYRGGSGVLHTALRAHLHLPDTAAVKRLLDEAGIRHRPGVRSPAGNGPGTHHRDFPPLPPTPTHPQESGVGAGQEPTTNNNNSANTPAEGAAQEGDSWIAEEIAQGYRLIPDPERGPAAWKVEHYKGEVI